MRPKLNSVKQVHIKTSIPVDSVGPVIGSKKTIDELVTVSFTLNPSQSIQLATNLLLAAGSWETIHVTGLRSAKRVTVTGYPIEPTDPDLTIR